MDQADEDVFQRALRGVDVVEAHARVLHGLQQAGHIDAHGDLYDAFEGDRYSHACPFARIMEDGLCERLVQVGIRTLTPHQREMRALGAVIRWVPNGMLNVTEKGARDYAAQSTRRLLLPLGLEHPIVVAAMMKTTLNVAYADESWPSAEKIPNLRYLGVGPEPSQIIKDVPTTAELVNIS